MKTFVFFHVLAPNSSRRPNWILIPSWLNCLSMRLITYLGIDLRAPLAGSLPVRRPLLPRTKASFPLF